MQYHFYKYNTYTTKFDYNELFGCKSIKEKDKGEEFEKVTVVMKKKSEYNSGDWRREKREEGMADRRGRNLSTF